MASGPSLDTSYLYTVLIFPGYSVKVIWIAQNIHKIMTDSIKKSDNVFSSQAITWDVMDKIWQMTLFWRSIFHALSDGAIDCS